MALRPGQIRSPAKKLTKEVLRDNPLLGALARERIKQIKALREEPDAQNELEFPQD